MASPTLACADVEASDAPTPYRQSTTTSTVYEPGAMNASPSRAVTTEPVTSAIRRPIRSLIQPDPYNVSACAAAAAPKAHADQDAGLASVSTTSSGMTGPVLGGILT